MPQKDRLTVEESTELLARANARVGTLLKEKYRIERVLGVGGMAVVYVAKHRNNAEFAIKMLHPELSLRKEMRDRFLREGYIANSVKHSGAVAVVDDDVAEDGAAFIVMEMLRGRPLDVLCQEMGGRLSVPAAVAITVQLLDVLASAHTNGIVHRDIKPANVFLTYEGTVKVLDFGIARLRDAANSTATNTGLVMGTPAYMSPEQALGRTSEIGPQTDVWAAAATLFSMLAASSVHLGENSQHLLVLAATTAPRPVLSAVPDIAPVIAQVIDKGLAFHKYERWLDATSMRDALRSAYVATYGVLNERELLAGLMQPSAHRGAATGVGAAVSPPGAVPGRLSTAAGSLVMPSPGTPPGGRWDVVAAPPQGATAVEAGTPNLPRYGETTAQPVATQRESLPRATPPSRRTGMFVAVAAGIAGLGIIGGGFAMLRHESAPGAQPSATALLGSPPTTVTLVDASSEVKPTPPVAIVSPVVEIPMVPPEPHSSAPPAPAPRPGTRHPAGGTLVPPTAVVSNPGTAPSSRPSVVTPQPTVPATKPGCDPNFYRDSAGVQHFKPECFE